MHPRLFDFFDSSNKDIFVSNCNVENRNLIDFY